MEVSIEKEVISKDLDKVLNWVANLKASVANLDNLDDQDEVEALLSISKILSTKSRKIHKALGGQEPQNSSSTKAHSNEKEKEIESLKAKIDKVRKEINRQSVGEAIIQDQLREKSAELDEIKARNHALEEHLEHSNHMVSELQERVKFIEEERQHLTSELEEKTRQTELEALRYEKEITELQEKLGSIEGSDKIDA